MLSVALPSLVMFSVLKASVAMLNSLMISVVVLNVMAPSMAPVPLSPIETIKETLDQHHKINA
jgi:hypothetical protein